jgi:hypothetical protein
VRQLCASRVLIQPDSSGLHRSVAFDVLPANGQYLALRQGLRRGSVHDSNPGSGTALGRGLRGLLRSRSAWVTAWVTVGIQRDRRVRSHTPCGMLTGRCLRSPRPPTGVTPTRRLYDATNLRDFGAIMRFYAADAVWDLSATGAGGFDGVAAIRGFYEAGERGDRSLIEPGI